MHHPSTRPRPRASLRFSFCWAPVALGVLLTTPLLASAQQQSLARPGVELPEVLNAQAAVPAVTHASTFARYRRLGDTPVVSWRDANDTVTRIGGWRVYTREAHAPEPPAAAGSAPAVLPAPALPAPALPSAGAGHGHHGPAVPPGARP